MEKYRPFFANLHCSIPGYTSQLNYPTDGFVSHLFPYKPVIDTMKIILQNYSTIEGLLYFHFDAWINPLKFNNINFRHIWFPKTPQQYFRCRDVTREWNWDEWQHGHSDAALAGTRSVTRKYSSRFETDDKIYCTGSADIYYIPRRFFNDFIDLGDIFFAAASFHEYAVPTMIFIIDHTYRSTSFHTVVTSLEDCWGHCCITTNQPADIQRYRCGHKMDLTYDSIRREFEELLDTAAVHLNKYISSSSKIMNNSSKVGIWRKSNN